jgi:hypothetical protein
MALRYYVDIIKFLWYTKNKRENDMEGTPHSQCEVLFLGWQFFLF